MKLVLAEKPSVAQSLAKVLGANKRCDGYLEGNGYIVSWCVGHLVELSPPEAYDETYAKWRLADLPILPSTWKYQVSSSTKKQFGILKKLMKRDDVESKTRATYEEYRKAGYSKMFLEAHREEITIHKAAKAAFDELGVKKLPRVKDLSIEYAEVLAAKKQAYAEYRLAKNDAQELLIAHQNIASLYEAERKEEDQKRRKDEQSH